MTPMFLLRAILASSMLLCTSACFTASTSPQPGTAPLRTGSQIASSVGDTTRKTQEKNPDLVLYATSIEEPPKEEPATPPREKARGTLTISSQPTGTIIIDSKRLDDATPTELSIEVGRHEIQILFPDGSISEVKTIDLTKDAPIQLYFAQPPSTPEQPQPSTDEKRPSTP